MQIQSTTGTSSPNSSGRKRGQTFSVMQMTDAARRLPISQDWACVRIYEYLEELRRTGDYRIEKQ